MICEMELPIIDGYVRNRNIQTFSFLCKSLVNLCFNITICNDKHDVPHHKHSLKNTFNVFPY